MLVKVLSLVFVRLIYEKVADNNVIAKRGPASFAKQSLRTICTQRCKKNRAKETISETREKTAAKISKKVPLSPP